MTARLRDWQCRLQACLAERWARPFGWGGQDCALFAADCADACTGVDPAADLRGTYSDALGAARVLAELGGLGVIAADRFGPEVPPLMAQPADVGLLIDSGRECIAVCTGAMWLVPGVDGLVVLPTARIERAWRLCKGGV
jgi:hypothetical protein